MGVDDAQGAAQGAAQHAQAAATAIAVCGPVTPAAAEVRARLPAADVVIAADGGIHAADALGLTVDVLVGDLDSVSDVRLAEARRRGTRIEQHARDKDATDLDLALDTALAFGVGRLVVVDGGVGPRLDHFLANALLLAHPRLRAVTVDAALGNAWISVVHPGAERTIVGVPRSIVSLLPIAGAVDDVSTKGLRWPLHGETLTAGSTRGISNELVAATASVRIGAGTLFVVQPLGGEQ